MNGFSQKTLAGIDGLRLVATEAGPVDGVPVVLLHGGGQTRHSWDNTMRKLAARSYRVVSYDARGHGESAWSPDGDYSIHAVAADLYAVLSTLPGPAVLVGASMGGLAAFCAIATSDRAIARALVLVDIVLRPTALGQEKIIAFMTSHRNGFSDLSEAAYAVAAYNPGRARPVNPSGLIKNLRQGGDGRLYWHWDPRLIESYPRNGAVPLVEQLESICERVTVPTLLVRGDRSELVDRGGIDEMRRLVPHMEVCEVPGAGHMVVGDQNDAFFMGMYAFLSRNAPA